MIYLASSSPRRRELLEQIGVEYSLVSVDVDETPMAGEQPDHYVERLARAKAIAASRDPVCIDTPMPILAADTAVIAGGRILSKPVDQTDGLAMLRLLSGQCHQVMTAVAVMGTGAKLTAATSCSEVCFRALTEAECLAYWNTGEPIGKAGGYAIQGKAALLISSLSGSYSGVMGLPLYETAQLLSATGIKLLELSC